MICKQHSPKAVPWVVLLISTKAKGVVNNWLLANLHMRFNVFWYVSTMFICEHSCFLLVALVVYVASYSYSGTCIVVTISFVVAANFMTLKPFNTAIGRR